MFVVCFFYFSYGRCELNSILIKINSSIYFPLSVVDLHDVSEHTKSLGCGCVW